MVLLQSVVAFVFMERHWNTVTQRLSNAVVQDIAALIEIFGSYQQDADYAQIRRIAQDKLGLAVDFLPVTDLPSSSPAYTLGYAQKRLRWLCLQDFLGRADE